MTTTTLKLIPKYGSAERPARLVRTAEKAMHDSLDQGECTEWPALVIRACDEMLARGTRSGDPAQPRGRQSRPVKRTPKSSGGNQGINMAAELLGNLVDSHSSCGLLSEFCRAAYPGCWDEALHDYASDPYSTGEPDPVLFDHSVSLDTACDAGPPWPQGIHEATAAVEDTAHLVASYSSHGLGLAHVAPGPIVWPPPPAPQSVTVARQTLSDAVAGTTAGQDEHIAMLHAYLAARDNPELADPSIALRDQVSASVGEWGDSVFPAGIRLAMAIYAHALGWVSADPERWNPDAFTYAYAEALLSVHHLRRATDVYDMTNAACRSYVWWWCHDRKLDVAGLRKLAASW